MSVSWVVSGNFVDSLLCSFKVPPDCRGESPWPLGWVDWWADQRKLPLLTPLLRNTDSVRLVTSSVSRKPPVGRSCY